MDPVALHDFMLLFSGMLDWIHYISFIISGTDDLKKIDNTLIKSPPLTLRIYISTEQSERRMALRVSLIYETLQLYVATLP